MTVPAIRRDPREPLLDTWRVATTRATVADVYASCQAHEGLIEAYFPAVKLAASRPLRVDVRARGVWQLRDDRGTAVGPAVAPRVIKKPAGDAPLACGA